MTKKQKFGTKLKDLRKKPGMTLRELAEKLGPYWVIYANWRIERYNPTVNLDNNCAFCKYLTLFY